MYVEDAVSAQGPIPVDVNPNISVGELKLQVAEEFNQINIWAGGISTSKFVIFRLSGEPHLWHFSFGCNNIYKIYCVAVLFYCTN